MILYEEAILGTVIVSKNIIMNKNLNLEQRVHSNQAVENRQTGKHCWLIDCHTTKSNFHIPEGKEPPHQTINNQHLPDRAEHIAGG